MEFIYLTLLASTILAMPGPTNTLLFSSGMSVGFFRTTHLIMAECIGYFISITLWGSSLIFLSDRIPLLMLPIKLLSALYILTLALKIWHLQQSLSAQSIQISFANVILATVFNPKAFVFSSYVFPPQAFCQLELYCVSFLAFYCALLPVSLAWSCAGHIIRLKERNSRAINIRFFYKTASIVLTFFSGGMIYNVFSG